MRFLGADLTGDGSQGSAITLVALAREGAPSTTERFDSLPALATGLADLVGDDPFLMAVNVPVVASPRVARSRPVENLVRRRLGHRVRATSRGSSAPAIYGETLIAGLAAAGHPCLPYPDRAGGRPGLAEIHPRLVLKVLLWEESSLAAATDRTGRDQLFRAYAPPVYRAADVPAKIGWAERASAIDLTLRALGSVPGVDLAGLRDALGSVCSEQDVERVGGQLDAALIAGTLRRYVESPETCLFLGERETGYVILPSDETVRRLALSGGPTRGSLFPKTSLRERLGPEAQLRAGDLLSVPGRPPRTEATFREPPRYEFDNRDEMLWWKHCRHVAGTALPTEGLRELVVVLSDEEAEATPLRLQRSRHRTLSFRFEPPTAWRARIPTRDGRTYPFRVLRAVYETRPPDA